MAKLFGIKQTWVNKIACLILFSAENDYFPYPEKLEIRMDLKFDCFLNAHCKKAHSQFTTKTCMYINISDAMFCLLHLR